MVSDEQGVSCESILNDLIKDYLEDYMDHKAIERITSDPDWRSKCIPLKDALKSYDME